jgi:FMN phosphatase YigB (HAD superfamily)
MTGSESNRRIEAVVFDVGETLINETRSWSEAAMAVGLPTFTVFGALGSLIQRGDDHRKLWDMLGVEAPPPPSPIETGDFYPDAIPALHAIRDAGYRIGIAGNQPTGVVDQLHSLALPVDFIASSAAWGVEKPSPEFFARVVRDAGVPAPCIAYVGDRIDNDVLPAALAGMFVVFIVRGPWGYVQQHWPAAAQAHLRIETLSCLVEALAERQSRGRGDPHGS